MKTLSIFLTAAVAVLACPACAADTAEKTPHRVPRVSPTVVIDGVLDDDAWRQALVMGVNTEVRPGDNIPAPVETDMLLAYSESHFYVAFRAYDPDPSLIRARLTDHDRMWDDEFVIIGVDTYNDQRGGFEFACNPLGIQGESASGVHGDGGSWDAIWDSAGRITDWGYAVEMAIPFSSLRFQRTEGDQIWGVDAVRSYPRGVRHHISLYPRDRDNNCYYCQMEKLVGFAGATPGRNIEITPTLSAIASQAREDFTEGSFEDPVDEYDLGLTARWGITPNVTLLATANPDFSQVESDAVQLNVNRRYALSYPEKRPFFLDGAGTFDYFYTRSIADPTWGVKLTGKEGSNGVGVIIARDEVTNLIFPGNEGSSSTSLDMETTATLVRYRRDVGQQSAIDLVFNGREGNEYYNRKWGASGNFWLTDTARVNAMFLTSATDYPDAVAVDFGQPIDEFSDDAFKVEVGHFTSGLDVYAEYGTYGRDFRADLMYFPEVGFSEAEAGFGHTWNSDSDSWWTMLNFGSAYNHQEKEDGDLRSESYRFWGNYNGHRESFANLEGEFGTDAYSGEEYDVWDVEFNAGFWPTGSFFVMADASYGKAIDYDNARTGRRVELTPSISSKMGRHLSVELNHTFERFDVDDGRLYTANVTYAKAVHQFNPRAFVRAILQYVDYDINADLYMEDVSSKYEGLSSQVLFSYKLNPQTVFFLGYSDSFYGDHEVDLIRTDRTVFAKIGYAFVL